MAQQPLVGQDLLIIDALGHITLGRTHLDEWPVRRSDLYLKTHNTHKRQTSMPSAKFELTIPASVQPQSHALDRVATGIGKLCTYYTKLHSHLGGWAYHLFLYVRPSY
jgi:hypothetical protein